MSWSHAGVVRLFYNRPALTAELMARRGLDVPPQPPRTDGEDLTDLPPAELRCDAVVRFGDPLVLAVVVEVQLAADDDKRRTWPAYLANLRLRLSCPCVLLVVTPRPAVARWARRPIELGPGFVLQPTVAGPDEVPRVTTAAAAREDPELAVLSALAHPVREVVSPVLHTVLTSDDPRHHEYADILLGALPIAREILEDFMRTHQHEFVSEFARKYVAIGREQGLEQGRQGVATALLAVLEARDVAWSAADEARIAAADAATLASWIRRAATADTITDVFDD